MRRSNLVLILLMLAAAGGWFFNQHYQFDGLGGIRVRPRGADPSQYAQFGVPPVTRTGNTIRVASFNIQVFGAAKEKKPQVMKVLADVVRRFDIVAVQEIRSQDDYFLRRFVDLVNAEGGRQFDYVLGPRLGRTSSKEQYAYIFDRASIEVDRYATYTCKLEGDRLHRSPLVSLFRVRGPPGDQAFTFQLVCVHTDPDETKTELDALADVYRYVRSKLPDEDDVIVLGDFNVDERHLGQLGRLADMAWVVSGIPTNTRGDKTYDNILFNRRATVEFTGRGGVMDVIREYKLTLDDALEISDHLPIWAEFSIFENGQPTGQPTTGTATRGSPSVN